MAESLRDELMSIPGIEEAELEGDDTSPAGVRVRLSAGADTDLVGEEVRRVLATHGMRSQLSAPDLEPEVPPPPPGAPASVVTLPGVSIGSSGPIGSGLRSIGSPDTGAPDVDHAGEQEGHLAASQPGGGEVFGETQVPSPPPAGPLQTTATPPVVRRLQSVAVEEGRAGVAVRVTADDGSVAERRARPGDGGLDDAVVAAIGELVDRLTAPPLLVEAAEQTIGGTSLITVVIERGDGSRCVGSAVSEGGRVYAVASAAWMALSNL